VPALHVNLISGKLDAIIPCDAMLARYLLLSSVGLSVCLNLAISKDKGTSLWNFAPIGGLNFAAASRLCCQQNSSTVELVDDTLTVDSSCCLLRVAQL